MNTSLRVAMSRRGNRTNALRNETGEFACRKEVTASNGGLQKRKAVKSHVMLDTARGQDTVLTLLRFITVKLVKARDRYFLSHHQE